MKPKHKLKNNIFKTDFYVSKRKRTIQKKQKPLCIWLTGLSGSGKTTIANKLEKELFHRSKHTFVLDGDNLRFGINKDLDFSKKDRKENIRRVAEISSLMVNAGLIVIVSIISPFRKERKFAKALFEKDEFYEIYISTPVQTCIRRDKKKLYSKAKSIKGFSKIGLTEGYEKPLKPFLTINTSLETTEHSVKKIIKKIFN